MATDHRLLRTIFSRLLVRAPKIASIAAGVYAAARATLLPQPSANAPIQAIKVDPDKPRVLLVVESSILAKKAGNATLIENQIQTVRALGYSVDALFVHRAGPFHDISAHVPDMRRFGIEIAYETGPTARLRDLPRLMKTLRPPLPGAGVPLARVIEGSRRMPIPSALASTPSLYSFAIAHYVQNVPLARRACPAAHVIVETHDVQSHLPAYSAPQSQQEENLQAELATLAEADRVIALNTNEATTLAAFLGKKKVKLIFPGFRGSRTAAALQTTSATPEILCVGSRHEPNLAGLDWFANSVEPLLAERRIRFILRVVGPLVMEIRQRGLLERYSAPWIDFSGELPDLGPAYDRAALVIVPIAVGTGISIKTVEAMAHGKAVVTRSAGLRGFPQNSAYPAHDHPKTFADQIEALLFSPKERAVAELRARALFQTHFSLEAYECQLGSLITGFSS